jgi:hypothetical protein
LENERKGQNGNKQFSRGNHHRRPLKNRSTLQKLPQKIGFREGTESNTPSEECSIALESLQVSQCRTLTFFRRDRGFLRYGWEGGKAKLTLSHWHSNSRPH